MTIALLGMQRQSILHKCQTIEMHMFTNLPTDSKLLNSSNPTTANRRLKYNSNPTTANRGYLHLWGYLHLTGFPSRSCGLRHHVLERFGFSEPIERKCSGDCKENHKRSSVYHIINYWPAPLQKQTCSSAKGSKYTGAGRKHFVQ